MDADDKRLLTQGGLIGCGVLLALALLGAGVGLGVRLFLLVSGLGG